MKDPVLLKQVSFATRICPKVFFSLLVIVAREMWCDDAPITDPNARVCSVHFTKDDFIKPVLQDFKPFKATLKPHAIPSVFSHCPLPKRRQFSEMRAARRDRKDIIDSLFFRLSCSEPYLSDASLSSKLKICFVLRAY